MMGGWGGGGEKKHLGGVYGNGVCTNPGVNVLTYLPPK